MSKALFQLWLASPAPAMALRVHLDPRSVSSEVRECANQLSPWFLTSSLRLRFWADLRCFGLFIFHLRSNSFSSSGQALCFADSVLCALTAASTCLEVGITRHSFLIAVLPYPFSSTFSTHFSEQGTQHERPRIFSTGSSSRLVFHTSMASVMCPKPYSSFDFSAMFQQWPFESIQISGLNVFLGM